MYRVKIRYLIILIIIMPYLLSGCSNISGFKATTEKTPEYRADLHTTFPPVAQLTEKPAKSIPATNIKVGFIFVGWAGDYGFTYAQNQGRIDLIAELGVETEVRENVPEDNRCIQAIQELIDSGCTVIFSCSYGFMDYTALMAEKYPDIYFFHCSGFEMRKNMSVYFGRIYQVRYLTGIVAGLRTETNQIGYVASFSMPEVLRGANAFALGVKSVNPDAVVKISWSNSWLNTGLEKELTLKLIRSGCDVITQHQDSLLPQIAAEEEGIWSIGYNSPMGFFSPNSYLTGAIWNWGPYMIEQVKQIEAGTWKPSNYWGGIKDGVVQLEELTENAAPGTKEAVDEAVRRIENGFDIFEGPIYDNEGRLRVAQGETMPDSEKLTINWLVDNIREVID